MTSPFEITASDIDRIVEIVLEDFEEYSPSDDLEETIGLYLEDTPGIDLLDPDDMSHLIKAISEKVRHALTLNGDDRKV